MKSNEKKIYPIKRYSSLKTCVCLCFLIILIGSISASDVLVWQGQYYTGTTFNTGTYEFNFTIYDNLTEGDICYSNTTNLVTGNFGEWKTEQLNASISCNNASKDYFLNINIDGTDQTPRKRLTIWNFLRKDINETTSGIIQTNTQIVAPIINATAVIANEINITSNANIFGTLRGHSPLKLGDEINFIKTDGTITSALYNAPRGDTSTLPDVFNDSLIHDIIEETNKYGMQECWWDENTTTMQMCISGAYLSGRATTISRSLQIVGNTTNKLLNENFTLCEGNNYIDCETDITGADLLVEDDIESIGSIFSQENITSEDTGFFNYLGSIVNRITKLFVQDIDFNGTINGIGNITTTGNITADYFVGDGSYLTGINGAYGEAYNSTAGETLTMTQNTWYNISGFFAGLNSGWYFNSTTNEIVCNSSGTYKVAYNYVLTVNSNDELEIQVMTNDIADAKSLSRDTFLSGKYQLMSNSYLQNYSVGDRLFMQIRDVTANSKIATFMNRNLMVHKIN